LQTHEISHLTVAKGRQLSELATVNQQLGSARAEADHLRQLIQRVKATTTMLNTATAPVEEHSRHAAELLNAFQDLLPESTACKCIVCERASRPVLVRQRWAQGNSLLPHTTTTHIINQPLICSHPHIHQP
jgi:hypothetical protein